MKLFDTILSLLAPYDCVGCEAEGRLICNDCRGALEPAIVRCYHCHALGRSFATCPVCVPSSPLESVMSATSYRGTAKNVVWRLKFGRTRGAADEMAAIMVSQLRLVRLLSTRNGLIVTHAPTATSRVRQRGYDQAALIARSVARRSNVVYHPLLARVGHQKQVGADKKQRVVQLAGAFRATNPRRIRGAHIILVDDVITTGATLEAAAQTLLDAGAQRVDAIVFAQA